ncbi:MAG TPA: hypothetical protein PK788_09175, partial [Gemmatimonadaceae bacterium]|nr:hypothetical protein [Gemmatimonadaceae bacterium]
EHKIELCDLAQAEGAYISLAVLKETLAICTVDADDTWDSDEGEQGPDAEAIAKAHSGDKAE